MTEAKKQFYRAFEEQYRGSRESIKERQKIHLSFIEPLHQIYPKDIVLDIGCGRGEWLELMRDEGITAKGVDLDEGMIEAGLELGLDIEKEDGIVFLRNAEDESAIAITAFHVVEHISFDELQDLVSEAFRVLKPGGLLILETPNPENIRVSCETFYLDPTHLRPIPSGLLTFMTEYYGYIRTKILRLQESELISAQKFANIGQVIEGASPDYAVIAQKEADPEIIELLDVPFAADYGLSLSNLVEKFERRMLRFEELVDKMIVKATKAEEFSWKAEIQAAEANENAKQAWLHHQMLVNSRSWKVTKPLRYATALVRHGKAWVKHAIRTIIRLSGKTIRRYPTLETKMLTILDHFPKLKQKLKKVFTGQDPLHQIDGEIKIDPPEPSFPNPQTVSSDLKKAIENQGKEK